MAAAINTSGHFKYSPVPFLFPSTAQSVSCDLSPVLVFPILLSSEVFICHKGPLLWVYLHYKHYSGTASALQLCLCSVDTYYSNGRGSSVLVVNTPLIEVVARLKEECIC